MKAINTTRTLIEIISDSIKLIFRNIKSLTSIMVFSIMLPSVGFSFVYLQNSMMQIFSPGGLSPLLIGIVVISFVFLFLHSCLVSVALVRSAQEGDKNNVKSSQLVKYFKKLYVRNFKIGILLMILVTAVGAIVMMFGAVSVAIGVIFGIIGLAIFALYVMPVWLYAQRLYLTHDDLSLAKAFGQANTDLLDNYGGSFATLVLSYITTSFLQYMILIPFMIVFFALGYAIEFDFQNSKMANPIFLIQAIVLGFGLSYLYLFVYISMFLKSYDLEERRTGEYTISQLQLIGEEKESFFENEGEY